MSMTALADRWLPKALDSLVARAQEPASRAETKAVMRTENAALSRLDRSAVKEVAAFNAPIRAKFPALLKIKYQDMAQNPFSFFRGTDHLFYGDQARLDAKGMPAGPWTLLQGDLHPANFGTLTSTKGKVAMGMNDYDEAYMGPAMLDLKRLAAGISLAARQSGLSPRDARAAIDTMATSYRAELGRLASGDTAASHPPEVVRKILKSASKASDAAWLDKLAPMQGGKRVLSRDVQSARSVSSGTRADLEAAFKQYRAALPPKLGDELSRFKFTDAVSAVEGTGSVGRARYHVLLTGPKGQARIFELKEEVPAAMAPHLPWKSPFHAEASRDLLAESVMSGDASQWFGRVKLPIGDALQSTSFLVRPMSATKAAVDPTAIHDPSEFRDLMGYYGQVVARGHAAGAQVGLAPARSLLKSLPHDAQLASGLGDFGQGYAHQVERDWQAFRVAVKKNPLLKQAS